MMCDNPVSPGGERTILVVDDSPVNRATLKKAFTPNYRIIEAGDGDEAMAVLRSGERIDALLLDIVMPKMNGFAVMDQMRADPKLALIPVIVVTAHGDAENEMRALDRGACDLILKPINPELVLRRVKNIIERRDAIIAAKNSANRLDDLTGLLNRRAFAAEVEHNVRAASKNGYVISCLDVDSFKVINDRFGFEEGDRLLRFIAEIRKDEVERVGGAACRDKADTFLTLLPNDESILSGITNHFLNALTKYDLPISIDVHIGRYVIDEPDIDVNHMIDRAMLAMRSVKESADVRIAMFDDDMRGKLLRQRELVEEMRPGLAAGQFILYYQPQYDYATHKLVGAEALVRWAHPEKGLVSPGEFIPLFESNGLIKALDEYVWEQACAHMRQWTDAGFDPVPVSVNISRRDIRNPGLPDMLLNLVRKYGLAPEKLRLEITESAYVDHPQQLINVVNQLSERGFSIEMDDFGSGYSSLNTLKDVPVDVLKLDMRFISDNYETNSRGGNILTSVVRMANWLKLPVIAEGVETKIQADYLRSIGCYMMQGYYFDRPMPTTEYARLLSAAPKDKRLFRAPEPETGGAAEFLDASTQATLLFNSFVGGAHIVEYDGKNVESLRANDRFIELLGCSHDRFNKLRLNLVGNLYHESGKTLISALNRAMETGDEVQCELHSLPWQKGARDFWTLNHIRFLARSEQRSIFYIAVENITERRELESTRLRLENIVKNVPAGIAIYEWEHDIKPVFFSDRACELFGYTREEYEAREDDKLHASFRPDLWGGTGFLGGEPVDNTYPAMRKDGTWFYLRTLASLEKREGQPPLIYATMMDVSRQREANEELSALINSVPGGVFKYADEEDDRISFVSDGLLELLGYTREEFANKFDDRFSLMVYEEDRERVLREIYSQIDENGSHDHCEYRIETRSGALKWVFDAGHLVREPNGRKWFYVIVIDINARRQLETKLAYEARRFEAMVANVPGGAVIIAAKSGEINCEYVSAGVDALVEGRHGNDILGNIHPEDRTRMKSVIEFSLKHRTAFNEDFRLKKAKGGYIWVNLTGNPSTDGDGETSLVCTYTDISEHMRLEKNLQVERDKMNTALRLEHMSIWDYDIARKTMTMFGNMDHNYLPVKVVDVPDSLFRLGFIDESSHEDYRALLREIDSGAKTATRNMLMKSAANNPMTWFKVTYHAIYAGGKAVSAIGTAINIEGEMERRLLEKEIDLVLDASLLYVWSFDCTTNAYRCRNRGARAFSTAEGLLDMNRIPPENRKALEEAINAIIRGEETAGPLLMHIDAASSGGKWLKAECAPVYDDNGEVAMIVIVAEDMTTHLLV